MIANRPALGVFPNKDWPDKLKKVLLRKGVSILIYLYKKKREK